MPTCFAYCRVSTNKQALSIDHQKAETLKYFETHLKPSGVEWPGGWFVDKGKSAYKFTFAERPAAREVLLRAAKGDHILICKLDRGFRNLNDMVTTLDRFQGIGVAVHVINLGLNTGTSIGRLVLNILGSVAEFEREMISERTREGLAMKRARGWKGNRSKHNAPWGLKWSGQRGKLLELDPEQLAILDRAHDLYVNEGFSLDAISVHLRDLGVPFPKRGRKMKVNEWDLNNVFKGLREAVMFRARSDDPRNPANRGEWTGKRFWWHDNGTRIELAASHTKTKEVQA